MCKYPRYIVNQYTYEKVLVPCGKCEVCQQQKADARAFRIRRSITANDVALFVTLTYNNECLPVIRRDEISPYNVVNVYRRNGGDWSVVDQIDLGDLGDMSVSDVRRLCSPENFRSSDYVAICYYPDVQRFMKRLRVNLLRHYHYTGKFKYYATTEYGKEHYRPHAHLLIIAPREVESTFRAAIDESWQYHDKYKLPRWIETSYDAASYAASYVNCGGDFPKILRSHSLRAKHSYSQDFGISSSEFSVGSILSKVDKGSLRYLSMSDLGKSKCSDFLIPKYVINRYFPIFKGYTRLDLHSSRLVLRCPRRYSEVSQQVDSMDVHKINVSLRNHYEKVKALLHDASYTYEDYCIDFERVWTCWHSCHLKDWYRQQVTERHKYGLENFYDNLYEVSCAELPTVYGSSAFLRTLPRPWFTKKFVHDNMELEERFICHDKTKKANYRVYKSLKYLR